MRRFFIVRSQSENVLQGLTMSGCEQEASNKKLRLGMLETYPECSKEYFVGSDTMGALAVAHEDGGLVLIAGTGSNARLVNPDGSQRNCGGWGFLISDEGSGEFSFISIFIKYSKINIQLDKH